LKQMRPPERIDEILELIGQIWRRDPDMRFMQLIYMLQAECAKSRNGWGKVVEIDEDGSQRVGFDLFNLEDDALKILLENHPQR
jgi:hypothetical protein